MNKFFFVFVFLNVFIFGCTLPSKNTQHSDSNQMQGKGVLLTTRFKSFEELKKTIEIEYKNKPHPEVQLSHTSNGQKVTSNLKPGINERDLSRTRNGNFFDKIKLTYRSPFFVSNRMDLMKVYILSRRRNRVFGAGDVAFFDLAKTMTENISASDLASINAEDLSEKGYLNTFNHAIAQAMMTSIFSEELADFVADTHERTNMSELITGDFTAAQLADIKNGPVDNYIDIINNEWGQELGKKLKKKFDINQETYWTPELLADYLNEMQSYFSWAFQIGFQPFRVKDEVIEKFSKKINLAMKGKSWIR